jgi:hypothetical protein
MGPVGLAEPRVVLLARFDHLAEHLVQPGGRQVEVHEAGTGNLDALDMGRRLGVEDLGDLGGQVAGVASRRLGGHEGHVAGPIPVLPPCRPLERDAVGRLEAHLVEGAAQARFQDVADHAPPDRR